MQKLKKNMRIQGLEILSMGWKIFIYDQNNEIHKPIKVLIISNHLIRIRNKSMHIFKDIPRYRKRENSHGLAKTRLYTLRKTRTAAERLKVNIVYKNNSQYFRSWYFRIPVRALIVHCTTILSSFNRNIIRIIIAALLLERRASLSTSVSD